MARSNAPPLKVFWGVGSRLEPFSTLPAPLRITLCFVSCLKMSLYPSTHHRKPLWLMSLPLASSPWSTLDITVPPSSASDVSPPSCITDATLPPSSALSFCFLAQPRMSVPLPPLAPTYALLPPLVFSGCCSMPVLCFGHYVTNYIYRSFHHPTQLRTLYLRVLCLTDLRDNQQ